MKIDKRFHDKYRAPYGVIPPRRHAQCHLDACKKSDLIKTRHVAESGRDRRHRIGRHGPDRGRRDLSGRRR
jgi:hypothetical protein